MAPGGVKSNINKQVEDTMSLPDNSYYKAIQNFVIDIARDSQIKAWDTEVFAKNQVQELLKSRPKEYLSVGPMYGCFGC
jgi:hypothetical protein